MTGVHRQPSLATVDVIGGGLVGFMASSRYSRVHSPQVAQQVQHQAQPFHFSNSLPDLSTDTVVSHSPDTKGFRGTPWTGTTSPALSERSDNVLPYRDNAQSLKDPSKAITPIGFERGGDSLYSDPLGPHSPDYSVLSPTTPSSWSKARAGAGKLPKISRIASPWQHGLSKEGQLPASRTVREFDPRRQRRRLFTKSALQWFITIFLCGALAACLASFESRLYMTLREKHAFNALVVGFSIFLGINLSSSLREYAQMLRWRLLTTHYRPLHEFELVMQCDSQRKVLSLFWTARTRGRIWPNKTQWLCSLWILVNLVLQSLVALLGLTYSLEASSTMQENFGQTSICDLSVIRDFWSAPNPSYYAQLGSANAYGIQGQDYTFTNTTPPSATNNQPTLYANHNWTEMEYRFQDRNVLDPDVTLLTDRTINATATCAMFQVVEGGLGNTTDFTYINEHQERVHFDAVRVGPGAMTYMGVLNPTCGPRCTEVMALQSAGSDQISTPAFFKCNSTVSPVLGVAEYVQAMQNASLYQVTDEQARIMAGAIGWSGFNFTNGDEDQYVRYSLDSWWSPNEPADDGVVARRVMEFTIEGIAAMDFNGPRKNVTGWYPVTAQVVLVQWRWAAAILGVIPFIQLLALICIIAWANQAIIKDTNSLSVARLLRPIVDKLGDRGCLLTGTEIAKEFENTKVIYGYREPSGFVDGVDVYRHVDVLEEHEGYGIQGRMPPGRYDGWEDVVERVEWKRTRRRRTRRRMSM